MFDRKTFIIGAIAALILILSAAFLSGYGPVDGRNAVASLGTFINGNFIPAGTSPAQVPLRHQEDDYGSAAGKE
jgi:hypothetical protein